MKKNSTFITSNRASRRGISELQSHHHAHESIIYFHGKGVLVLVIPTGCYVVCTCRVLARLFKQAIRIRVSAEGAEVEKKF